jgi:hypothetical protein
MSMRPPRPARFDIVVFGSHFANWLATLAAGAPLWRGLEGVGSVRLRDDAWRGEDSAPESRLVLPLLEPNIRSCPAGWALVPPPASLEVLADKALFARYLAARGFESLAPATYWTPAAARFPAVVKRTDMFAGQGVRIVDSAAELEAALNTPPWAGHPVVIQDYVAGNLEYVLQAVLVRGVFVWTAAFEVVIPDHAPIRHPNSGERVRPVELPARELIQLQRIIAPLGFSGPVNFNFRRRPNGDMALFEINPRLGGSLFRPEFEAILAAVLGTIIQHAAWRANA